MQVEVIKEGNYVAEICQYQDGENPRKLCEMDSKMVCFHNKYKLGDKHDFKSLEEYRHYIEKYADIIVFLPLYLYDHSGLFINVRGYIDKWDSSCVGGIYILKERLICRTDINEDNWKGKAKELLEDEVRVYDYYLQGEVYDIAIYDREETGETNDFNNFDELDIACNLYGIEEARTEANRLLKYYNETDKERQKEKETRRQTALLGKMSKYGQARCNEMIQLLKDEKISEFKEIFKSMDKDELIQFLSTVEGTYYICYSLPKLVSVIYRITTGLL